MRNHPLNLALRFLLEMGALVVFAVWGWNNFPGLWSILAAIGLPVFFATLWGVFAVKGDPSRSGKNGGAHPRMGPFAPGVPLFWPGRTGAF